MVLSPELAALLKGVLKTQEQIGATLLKLNEEPNVATPAPAVGIEQQSAAAPANRRFITPEERQTLSSTLRTKSIAEISALITHQAAKTDVGVPLGLWLNTAGFAAQTVFNQLGDKLDPDIAKALDTGAVGALIRQDLEPMLYEVFIRSFPAYDRMPKEPANGLLHAWNQITSYGAAKFMAELGTVSDDNSVFHRESTNVAILATRRGISLKSQFAVMAGGMNYNPEAIELQGGLRAMAHTMQKAIFEGQSTVTTGTAADESGLYDANGFTGLRSILNTANAVNLDPATAPTAAGNFRVAIDKAELPVTQSSGLTSIIWGHPQEKITFDEQQDINVRLVGPNYMNIGVGATAQAVNTYAGQLPFAVVPGDSISSYTDGGGTLRRDLYMLDEGSITLPYLGSPGPTVLEIPIGISGQLTHLFIIFMMNGLAVKVLPWNNKIRVKVAS
jgi:hypothetical protein